MAAMRSQEALVQLLVEHNAKVNAVDQVHHVSTLACMLWAWIIH